MGVVRGANISAPKNLRCYETCARPTDEEWRRLHNEELHDLHSSPNMFLVIISRRMKWAGHVASMGDWRNEYRDTGLDGQTCWKEPLGRPRHRREDNTRMDLQEVGWGGIEEIPPTQDRDR